MTAQVGRAGRNGETAAFAVQCNHVQKKLQVATSQIVNVQRRQIQEQRQHGELFIQLQYSKYQQKQLAVVVNTKFAQSSFYE